MGSFRKKLEESVNAVLMLVTKASGSNLMGYKSRLRRRRSAFFKLLQMRSVGKNKRRTTRRIARKQQPSRRRMRIGGLRKTRKRRRTRQTNQRRRQLGTRTQVKKLQRPQLGTLVLQSKPRGAVTSKARGVVTSKAAGVRSLLGRVKSRKGRAAAKEDGRKLA